jgi:lysophospholipase L1-like esterase
VTELDDAAWGEFFGLGDSTRSHKVASNATNNHSGPLRILPLGDSITFGFGDGAADKASTGGYRTELWRMLQANWSAPQVSSVVLPQSACGVVLGQEDSITRSTCFHFVGSLKNGPADIDTRHEGHPGWQILEVDKAASQGGWWTKLQPDVVLLMLGTNDLGMGGASAQEAARRMDTLLLHLFQALPRVVVLLASLTGAKESYGGSSHDAYNEELMGFVPK